MIVTIVMVGVTIAIPVSVVCAKCIENYKYACCES